MTNLTAFNNCMEEFLLELIRLFPEERKILVYKNSFDLTRRTNAKKPLEFFMSGATQYSEQILNKDEKFFLEDKEVLEYAISKTSIFKNELGLVKLWNSGIDTHIKNCIWQYIQTLFCLGCSITNSS